MYRRTKPNNTKLIVNDSTKGETIEKKVQRVVNNGEAIKDGAPILYTERKEGVRADTNIRTDRWELAAEAMGAVQKAKVAKREGIVVPIKTEDKKESGNTPEVSQ